MRSVTRTPLSEHFQKTTEIVRNYKEVRQPETQGTYVGDRSGESFRTKEISILQMRMCGHKDNDLIKSVLISQ